MANRRRRGGGRGGRGGHGGHGGGGGRGGRGGRGGHGVGGGRGRGRGGGGDDRHQPAADSGRGHGGSRGSGGQTDAYAGGPAEYGHGGGGYGRGGGRGQSSCAGEPRNDGRESTPPAPARPDDGGNSGGRRVLDRGESSRTAERDECAPRSPTPPTTTPPSAPASPGDGGNRGGRVVLERGESSRNVERDESPPRSPTTPTTTPPSAAAASPDDGGNRGGRVVLERGESSRNAERDESPPRSPTTTTTPDSPAPVVGRSEISPSPAATSSKQPSTTELGKLVPIKRPDGGGTTSSTSSAQLLVNHFLIRLDNTVIVYNYDMDVTPIVLPGERPDSVDMAAIKTELFSANQDEFPADADAAVAHDGQRNLFSPYQLPAGDELFVVQVRDRRYNVTLKLVKRTRLADLEQTPGQQRDILQGLDVIMRVNSLREMFPAGRGIYWPASSRKLECGVHTVTGFQQSIKPTENGPVLCLDNSVAAFYDATSVIEFLQDRLRIPIEEHTRLDRIQRNRAVSDLKGLRVVVTHRDARRTFRVFGLTELSSNEISFVHSERGECRLVDYYRDAYRRRVRFGRLPCLDLSKSKQNYVPMEFCRLEQMQKFPMNSNHILSKNASKDLKNAADRLKKMGTLKPAVRIDNIHWLVNEEDGPCRGALLDVFRMSVSNQMTRVTGRILRSPSLNSWNRNGQRDKLQIERGSAKWSIYWSKVSSGMRIERWAIVDFGANQDTERFIWELRNQCNQIRIEISDRPLFVWGRPIDDLSDPNELEQTFTKAKDKAGGKLQLLICLMGNRHVEGYKYIKLIAETQVGIMTQCCCVRVDDMAPPYYVNLGLKINAKLGGSNFELYEGLPRFGQGRSPPPFMFIGADVNHPGGRDDRSPSIAAVVASMNWPAATRYVGRVEAQPPRVENIVNVGGMCRDLIELFDEVNRVRPASIVYFRDGVSDSQFDTVLNQELAAIKEAVETDGYKPQVTVVVAQKRHSTRLFTAQRVQDNVAPGTVVDTAIVAPNLFNFYLCSHQGLSGTSKPTHYYVLWDEHRFGSDELQQLLYELCFTYARCARSVSLVPPVYYADLLAYRGRLYHEASAACPDIGGGGGGFPTLHSDVQDKMYFV